MSNQPNPKAGIENNAAVDAEMRERLLRRKDNQPLLLRGGTVVTMDDKLGVLDRGDVLIRRTNIETVLPNISPPEDALVIDASGKLLFPGFVDAHRHTWQTITRGVGVDWTLLDYFNWMVPVLDAQFRPEDVYAANMLAALESVDGGITTIGDWADAGHTPEHSEAAAKALEDSGIRGRFHYANVYAPNWVWGTTPHVVKMWDKYGSPDGRVSMQMGLDTTVNPAFPEAVAWKFAQDRGISIATHAGLFGWDNDAWIGKLHKGGFMKPDVTYIHVVAVPEKYIEFIRDTGGSIIMATCSNCNAGQGYPRITPLHQHGIPIALGSDTDMRWNQPMFDNMRKALDADHAYQHMMAQAAGHLQPFNQLRSEDALKFATLGGARALGLSHQIGSISPGKRADISNYASQ